MNRPTRRNQGAKLNCERLEDRDVPSYAWQVTLQSSAQGVPGDTDAQYGGGLVATTMTLTGTVASTPEDAIRRALSGSVTFNFPTLGLSPVTYTFAPETIGTSASDHLPFLLLPTSPPISPTDPTSQTWKIWVEDLTGTPATPDWDYNDRSWDVVIAPLPGPAQGDLDIFDLSGVMVAEDKEVSPGGWVAVNNDNDNYNFVGDQATSLVQKYDKDENGQVTRENDLVKIVVKDLAYKNNNPASGYFTLDWASTNIKVWKSADKGAGEFTSGGQVSAAQSTFFWVEGLQLSGSVGAEALILTWHDSAAQNTSALDTVAFTVYQVDGVLNAPSYSTYKYKLTSPAVTGAPLVMSVSGGTKKSEITYGFGGGSVVETTVLWGAGAEEGKVRLSPGVAVGNFWTNREVNVVKVEITSQPGANVNELKFNNAPHQLQSWPGAISSESADSIKQGIVASLQIIKIEGAPVDNSKRGVRFMEVGFIQDVTFTKKRSQYFDLVSGKVVNYFSTVEGQTYLDCATFNPSTPPWQHSKSTLTRAIYPRTEVAPVEQTKDDTVNNMTFGFYDSPAIAVTDKNNLTLELGGESDTADFFNILFDARLYFAVRTKEAALGSESIYTQRAKAVWHFDGNGTITGTQWTQTGNGTMEGTSSGTEKKKFFVEINDGSVVPITSGTLANYATAAEGWMMSVD